ncbi:MAG: YraN family protein [Rhodospirillaceae bacterium]|nr:YraN family protein [Rhodospirillaceae bacterium]
MADLSKVQRGREAQRRGHLAEVLCLIRLWLTGWWVISHRLTPKRGTGLGEIDIIARRGRVLAFIEVKARRKDAEALESINPAQRQRIQNSATSFLARHPEFNEYSVRFDAMVVTNGFWPGRIADAWRPD